VNVPVLGSLIASNKAHIERALDSVVALNRRKIGFFGLTFKSGTDDLRESPLVELVERLVGKGFEVSIFDPILVMARLMGANLAQVEDRLPHLTQLLVEDPQLLVESSEVLVVGSRDDSVLTALAGVESGVDVLDLVRLPDDMRAGLGTAYHAIAW
jgi:GDP-mannose 6-dehydrogenase